MSFIPTIAVDFDGTLTLHSDFPVMGKINPYAKEFVQNLSALGYKVILWTCRKNSYLTEALSLLKQENIYDCFDWDYLEDPDNFGDSGKVIAYYYIDDRGLLGFDLDEKKTWEHLFNYITKTAIIEN